MPAPASSGLAPIQEQQPAQQPALQPPPPAYGAFPAAPVTSPVSTSHHRAAPPLPPVSSRAAFAGQLPSMAAAPATAPPPVPPKPQTLAAVDASALPARLEAPRVLTMQIDTSWHKEALADEMPAPASPIATISSTDLAELQVDRTTEAAHAFVARTMDERMHEFTRRENLRVYTATWNVNGKLEDQALVTRWLEAGLNDRAADIVAIGLQEMIELSATNVVGSSIVDTQSRERAAAWLDMFRESLRTIGRRSNVDYELVASTQMVGIFLAVFARITLLHSVKDVQMGSAATGAGGLLGNKGGCAIRFQCYDTSVCFVSAHLAAHRNAVAARNDDYATITTKRMFVNSQLPVPAASSKGTGMRAKQIGAASRIIGSPAERHMASASTVGKQGKDEMQQVKARLQALEQEHDVQSVIKAYQYTVLDHDLVFWVGDLNYRIIEEVPMDVSLCCGVVDGAGAALICVSVCARMRKPPQDVYDMINTGMIEKLTASDQLNIERAAGRVFQEFNEGKLTFAPTYKYIPGQDIYDQRPEKKMRCPAWCDRYVRTHLLLLGSENPTNWRATTLHNKHLCCDAQGAVADSAPVELRNGAAGALQPQQQHDLGPQARARGVRRASAVDRPGARASRAYGGAAGEGRVHHERVWQGRRNTEPHLVHECECAAAACGQCLRAEVLRADTQPFGVRRSGASTARRPPAQRQGRDRYDEQRQKRRRRRVYRRDCARVAGHRTCGLSGAGRHVGHGERARASGDCGGQRGRALHLRPAGVPRGERGRPHLPDFVFFVTHVKQATLYSKRTQQQTKKEQLLATGPSRNEGRAQDNNVTVRRHAKPAISELVRVPLLRNLPSGLLAAALSSRPSECFDTYSSWLNRCELPDSRSSKSCRDE